ncbi:polyketide synthase [Methylocystis iwaonis]|uniref:Polyketide synthase n=1 Tax=Methylocystis iwaonis TaxID=2885079 RepID=A0ABN6VNT9_9HYPH|nr:polyketide synthase [Methylocystis iwaonis]BDV36241.1 polyketide synthase [Methylocystis iwaonis]
MQREPFTIEPVAIVGVGCLHPWGAGIDAFRRLLADERPEFAPYPIDRFWRAPPAVRARLSRRRGAFFGELGVDLRQFRIPKVYDRAVSTITPMLMQAARDCVRDAGYGDEGSGLPKETVDVIVGTCFGLDSALTNALKIHGLTWLADGDPAAVEAGREALRARFGSSSHDRLGEMSSSIASRIGAMYGWRGRIMAMEDGDSTGYAALRTAILSLAERQSDAALIATGQRFESVLAPLVLAAKGFDGDSAGAGAPLCEGAVALLLKRLEDARRDGDRIRAVVAGIAARRTDALEFRYAGSDDAARECAREACFQAGLDIADVASVECVVPGLRHAGAATAAAAFPGRPLTCATSALGHGFANAGLTGIVAAILSLDDEDAPKKPLAVFGVGLGGLTWTVILDRRDKPRSAGGPFAEPASAPEPIAVVGLGGCFGPSLGRSAYWEALCAGADGIGRISDRVLPRGAAFSGGAARALTSYAENGGELNADWEIHRFDAKRLRLFPKRVAALDVAHRIALSVAAEALDDFGLDAGRRADLGKAMVVCASPLCLARERELSNRLHSPELGSVLGPDESRLADAERAAEEIDSFTLDGLLAGNIAALISSCFQLSAETMAIEAACASSLAAVHVGMQALRLGYADFVVAGGVELPVNMRDLILCSTQLMLSRDKIAPFAANADGFSPGDGAGMFVLRRLSDARRDNDPIYGCIIGVGASSDAASMTAPDPQGQALAIRRAFADGRASPDSIAYVEAHGTGTRIGDGVEISALRDVYGGGARRDPLLIGSVKSNIGHAFAAAGAAGLMKTLLALNSETVPPTLLRRELNPDLALAAIPGAIVSKPRPWPASDGPRRAAINSFGTGGVNFHILVEAP